MPAAAWQRQLGVAAVAAWRRWQRQSGGGGSLAMAWPRRQLGGGSLAVARRRQLGGGSLAAARRRRQRGGGESAAAAAWRRSRGGGIAVAAHSVTAAAAWRWCGSGGSFAAAAWWRRGGSGRSRQTGRGEGQKTGDSRKKGLIPQSEVDKQTHIQNRDYPPDEYKRFTPAEKAKLWQLRHPGQTPGTGPTRRDRDSSVASTSTTATGRMAPLILELLVLCVKLGAVLPGPAQLSWPAK